MILLSASKAKPRKKFGAKPDIAVSVKDVSIEYRTTFERVPTFKKAIVRFGRGERAVKNVKALDHVSFDVELGRKVGVIGANGAGKSTLMRALAGALPPSTGRIDVHGNVSSLLALGVGFNPLLTGRENIMLGGLAAGMTRDAVRDRADAVTEFAELEGFIEAQLRTYSSGMLQRLAFSVSVALQPDVLLVDEALSAGDAHFRTKAAAKMDEMMESARAMFLVSHSLGTIKELCDEAIWLHKGKLMMRGTTDECVKEYEKFLNVGETALTMEDM